MVKSNAQKKKNLRICRKSPVTKKKLWPSYALLTKKKLYVNLSSNGGQVQHRMLILAAMVAQANTLR